MVKRASVAVLLVVGCGGDDDPLDDHDVVAGWANASSALGAYFVAHQPVSVADGASTYPDPQCPTVSDDGTTLTITGDCTEADGRNWYGVATVARGAANARTVTFTGFGNDAFVGPSKTTGTVTVTEQAADRHSFVVDVVHRGGITTTVDYEGTVAGTYATRTTWNGAGTITRDGDFYDGGTIQAATVDQARDDMACPGESLSGTTTMTGDSHEIVITYDGATDCDDNDSARWSVDGKDRGTIAGITCASSRSPGTLALVAFALIGVLSRRRAARADRSRRRSAAPVPSFPRTDSARR